MKLGSEPSRTMSAAQPQPTGGTSNFQFQCPTCGALLQALLRQELTSVQCGECFDVFDVQMPARCNLQFSRARIREISTPHAPCPEPRPFPAPRARAPPSRPRPGSPYFPPRGPRAVAAPAVALPEAIGLVEINRTSTEHHATAHGGVHAHRWHAGWSELAEGVPLKLTEPPKHHGQAK